MHLKLFKSLLKYRLFNHYGSVQLEYLSNRSLPIKSEKRFKCSGENRKYIFF